jgi:hypothetical protein
VWSGCFWSWGDTCIGCPNLETDITGGLKACREGLGRESPGTVQNCIRHTKSTESSPNRGLTALIMVPPLGPPLYQNERTNRLSLGAAGPHSHAMSNTSLNIRQN